MRNESPRVHNVLMPVFMLSLGLISWIAQGSQSKTKDERTVTVTGCLQKGNEAGQYSTGEDVKRYAFAAKASICPNIWGTRSL
jgi:hypothetical protein